jgi:hypothetical protein
MKNNIKDKTVTIRSLIKGEGMVRMSHRNKRHMDKKKENNRRACRKREYD